MKKSISILLVFVLLFALAVPTFAAGINSYEQKLINYVQTKYKTDKGTITVPKAYINAAENVCNTIDITEAQYDEIISILDEAYDYVLKEKLVTMNDLKKNAAAQDVLLGYAEKALAVIEYTATADRARGLLIIKDADEKIVAQLKPGIIVQTGANNVAIAAFSAIAVLTAAGAVSVKKFRKEDNVA